MSNEIATYSMILSKLSLGKSGTECPTKTQILAINSLIVIDNASTYGANECVKIDDIRKKAETWNYYLTVSPTSMSFGADGGSKSFTVSSYKRKVLDGVEQSGDTNVSLKSTTISGTGFSLSGTTVSASANESTSNRTGTVTITQNESNKTLTINVSQDAKPAEDEYYLGVRKSGETSSYESITFNNVPAKTTNWSGDYTYVSRKNGEFFSNVSFSTNVSWITVNSSGSYTVSHNTSGLPRSGTITLTQGESGLKCYIYIYQQEYIPTYGIGVNPSKINISYMIQQVNFSVNSYKTVLHSDGSVTEETVDYVYSSNTDWFAPFATSTTNVTSIAVDRNTSSSERTGTFVLSNEKSSVTVTVTQAGQGGVTDTFTVTPSSQTVSGNSATAVVNSSSPWTAHIGQGTIYSTVSPTSGSAGQTTITISDATSSYQEVQATITRTSPSYKEITATVIFVR